MSDLLVFPDIEKALLKHALTLTPVTTLVSNRVWTQVEPSPVWPFMLMRKLSSRARQVRWLETVTIEVQGEEHHTIANAESAARLVCETGVAMLNSLKNHVLDGCVIAGPIATTGPRSVPDQLAPGITNPRYIAEVTLTYHPL